MLSVTDNTTSDLYAADENSVLDFAGNGLLNHTHFNINTWFNLGLVSDVNGRATTPKLVLTKKKQSTHFL